LASFSHAKQGSESADSKEGKVYASVGLALNEFRSIKLSLVNNLLINRDGEPEDSVQDVIFPITAQTYGSSVALGTYITNYFKTELRFGKGLREDTIGDGSMDINLNYWFNWYIGGTYPVTEYASAYALYGVSFYDADVTRYQIKKTLPQDVGTIEVIVQPSSIEMEEELFGTKFSQSWMLGLDFHLFEEWYLALEYGRLLRDDDSNIKVYQAGAYLRYEF